VPVFNSADFLRACLESILGQTHKDLEVIAADDHSTDGSQAIIKEFAARHPGVIKGMFSTRNKGVSSTRHAAILEAKGEYITTLDSDDYYFDSRKLEAELGLVRQWREKTQKDVLAFSKVARVARDGALLEDRSAPEGLKEGNIFPCILTRTCEIPRDFVMRKALYFQVGGFNPTLRMYEDWDLKIRLARRYEFVYTGICGTAYRKGVGGLSSAPIPEQLKWLNRVFRDNLHLVEASDRRCVKKRFREHIHDLKGLHIRNLKKDMKAHLAESSVPNPFPFLFEMLLTKVLY